MPAKEVAKTIKAKSQVFPDGIPECGTDALRFGLLSYMTSSSINLSVPKVVGYKHFCNKLWNIVKFALTNFTEGFQPEAKGIEGLKLSLSDKWIITKLSQLITATNERFDNYDYGWMVQGLYDFWLKELADYYIEAIKPVMKGKDEAAKKAVLNTLYLCLDSGLRMLHPTMPYLTEELFQRLPHRKGEAPESICIAPFPETLASFASENVEDAFNDLQLAIVQFRSLFASLSVGNPGTLDVQIKVSDAGLKKIFDSEVQVLQFLVKSKSLTVVDGTASDPAGGIKNYLNEKLSVYILQAGDLISKALVRVEKKKKELLTQKAALDQKLSMKDYATKVPEKVQKENAAKLEKLTNELAENQKSEAELSSISK